MNSTKIQVVFVILCISLQSSKVSAQLGLHVEGNQTVLFGNDTTEAGTKFIWYPKKRVLLAGSTGYGHWDYDSIGSFSFAFGGNNAVSGSLSGVWGSENRAIGSHASAWGNSNQAYAYATTWGAFNAAIATLSSAWGSSNLASGRLSTVWGGGNIAQSSHETVIGRFADTLDHANYDVWEDDDYLFVVGNGIDINSRSNALSLYKSGDLSVGRKLTIESYDSPWGVEDDDCVIYADPSKTNSDLILVANDAVAINIDDDNNSNASFQVLNGTNVTILNLDENGNLNITGTLFQGSDRNRKENIENIESDKILERLDQLPVYEWQYKGEETRHLGPMAQDFHQLFGYGVDDKSISAVDVDGVLLTAIKAQQKEIEKLKETTEAFKEIQVLKEIVASQQKMIMELERKLNHNTDVDGG